MSVAIGADSISRWLLVTILIGQLNKEWVCILLIKDTKELPAEKAAW